MNSPRLPWARLLYHAVVAPLGAAARAIGADVLNLERRERTLWQPHHNPRLVSHRRRATVVLGTRGSQPTYVLGLSAFYHDSAAALLRDGVIVAAAQEERFTRRRHDPGFPTQALSYCLHEGRITIDDVALVVFYEDPVLKFRRLLKTFVAFAPHGRALFEAAMPVWLGGKLRQRSMIADAITAVTGRVFRPERLVFSEHHLSHAASAYYPSPFDEAAVLTIDGVGEYATTTIADATGDQLDLLKEIHFPHSLGLLYSAFTAHLGFAVNSGEYKLMGLAPYGEPRYAGLIRDHLIDLKPDGSFWLNMRYFDYGRAVRTTNADFEKLIGSPARRPDEDLTRHHMDLAASIQRVIQEAILGLAREAATVTGRRNLCLAGGVALNCVANGHLLRAHCFERIWIQPAAGDAGGALGAAYVGHILYAGRRRARSPGTADMMQGALLGPSYTSAEIALQLSERGARFHQLEDDALLESVANALAAGKAVGWFSGRMELGPRALGSRSILADPRSPTMQRTLNLKIKNRESFRPFAPAVLHEEASDRFELAEPSPFMLLVAPVRSRRAETLRDAHPALAPDALLRMVRSDLPAVTHVDGSARVQTVHAEDGARFHQLLHAFKRKTGVGVLVNTSFNVRGEPIVCSPADAYHCFMGTALDILVLENFLLRKEEQDAKNATDYARSVPPD